MRRHALFGWVDEDDPVKSLSKAGDPQNGGREADRRPETNRIGVIFCQTVMCTWMMLEVGQTKDRMCWDVHQL